MEKAALKKRAIKEQFKKADSKLWAAKILFAKKLYDDVVSRAYYAIFHAASAVLFSQGISVESHRALKVKLGLHCIKTGKINRKYGRILSRLKDERENGDYDIFVSFNKRNAENAIVDAQDFIKAMKRYLKNEK